MEEYLKNVKKERNSFLNRLSAIWKVLTERNFIFIGYNLEEVNNKPGIKIKVINRTDFNAEADKLALLLALERQEERIKKIKNG